MIPAKYYSAVFLYTVLILTIIAANQLSRQRYIDIKRGVTNYLPALLLCIIFALFLGFRPISGSHFGDTSNYALTYKLLSTGSSSYTGDETEWLWAKLMYICSQTVDISIFFTIVDIGYFGLTLWACKRLCPNNILVAILFMLGSISFYSYGTNGIRNGLACSGVLLMFSYLGISKKDNIIAFLIAMIVVNIHRTTILPIAMSIISLLWVKNFRWAYSFWIASIAISLVAGGAVTAFFSGLGFDKRVSYLTSIDDGMFSHTGFRWDFLIYSMMPIILGYYIIIKRGIRNNRYELLLNTYTLANAFWVMVIRANYSNRFAYLSWFMYPIVLAYPLLKLDIWDNQQGKRASQIMLAHIGFTWFMETFYW